MNKVDMNSYYEKQANFLAKHDCRMEQDGDCDCYRKTWMSDDGAFMIEINRVITECATVNVKGIECKVKVKLFETECYSSEFGSMYLYQKA